MADPIPYDPSYSFSDWQTANPSKPLPAPQLDNELENIERSIDSLIDGLGDIRRSDGKLQNRIVTVDSLDDDLTAQLADSIGALVAEKAEEAAVSAAASAASAGAAQTSADLAAAYATQTALYGTAFFPSRTEAATFTILPATKFLFIAGYANAGDGGAALYKRAVSEPAHAGKIQTADGSWWEIAERIVSPPMFGAFGDNGATVCTTQVNNMLAYVSARGGGSIFWPKSAGYYTCDVIIPPANTTITLEPGTEIRAISAGSRVFQIQTANVHIIGYGAKTFMSGTQSSHNVYILYPASRCSVRGLWVVGSGNTGDDCIYIGGNPALSQLAKDIDIIDCKVENGSRNCISVVACDGYLIEGCDISGAGTSPGAGIDVEANAYLPDGSSACKNGKIRRNRVHNNGVNGIVVVFGSDVEIDENLVYDNGSEGITAATGGTQFDQAVYRAGDLLGVIAIDSATGWIQVTSTALLTDDFGIRPGFILQRGSRNGATWPTEIPLRCIVSEISVDQHSLRVSEQFEYNQINATTGTGTGTKAEDPFTSHLYFQVFREGQCSGLKIRKNKLWNNGGAADIRPQTAVDVEVSDNDVQTKAATAISFSYVRDARARRNKARPYGTATPTRGVTFGTCSDVSTEENDIARFANEGVSVAGCSRAQCVRDKVVNCGTTGSVAYRFQLGVGPRAIGVTVRNDPKYPATIGLQLDATATYGLISSVNCKGAGNSNANSIISNATSRVIDSIVNDGTFRTNTA